MALIRQIIRCELDPLQPVAEACAVINALTQCHPRDEAVILQGVKDKIDVRLSQLQKKGESTHAEPLCEFGRKQKDQ